MPLRISTILVQGQELRDARGPLVLEELGRPLDVMSKPVRDLLFSFQNLGVLDVERVVGLRGKSPVSRRRGNGAAISHMYGMS